jgi:hypothetical protein
MSTITAEASALIAQLYAKWYLTQEDGSAFIARSKQAVADFSSFMRAAMRNEKIQKVIGSLWIRFL